MTNGHLADLPWRRDVRRFHPDALPGLFSRSVGWSMMNVVAAMQLKDFIVGSGLGSIGGGAEIAQRQRCADEKRKTEVTRQMATMVSQSAVVQ